MIVTVGWAIYPLGYIFGYLTGGVDANSLNVIYNAIRYIYYCSNVICAIRNGTRGNKP